MSHVLILTNTCVYVCIIASYVCVCVCVCVCVYVCFLNDIISQLSPFFLRVRVPIDDLPHYIISEVVSPLDGGGRIFSYMLLSFAEKWLEFLFLDYLLLVRPRWN